MKMPSTGRAYLQHDSQALKEAVTPLLLFVYSLNSVGTPTRLVDVRGWQARSFLERRPG